MRFLLFLILAVVYLHVSLSILDTVTTWYQNCMATLTISK